MKINIRNANIFDGMALSRCSSDNLPISYGASDFANFILSRTHGVLVADGGGIRPWLLGYLVYNKEPSKNHITSFAVYTNFRRQGVGSQLINRFLQLSRLEWKKSSLYVHVDNVDAIQFYKKAGFQITCTVKQYYPRKALPDARSLDAYYMVHV